MGLAKTFVNVGVGLVTLKIVKDSLGGNTMTRMVNRKGHMRKKPGSSKMVRVRGHRMKSKKTRK